jgi:hypothetical protein
MKTALTLLLLATLLCSSTTTRTTAPPYPRWTDPVRPGWTHKTIFGLPLPLSFSHTIYF